MALRLMRKNLMHTSFNILALAMGIGCCITIFLFVYTMTHADRFHENGESIFMIGHVKTLNNGSEEKWGWTAAALAPAVKEEVPGLKWVGRVDGFSAFVKDGDKVFDEFVRFVEPGFFDVFTFPMELGNPDVLNDPGAVILSHNAAVKYFGTENPIGKTLDFQIYTYPARRAVVKGVLEPFDRRASFEFDFVMSYDVIKALEPKAMAWNYNVEATFVQLENPSQAAAVQASLQRYVKTYNEVNANQKITGLYLMNLYDLSANSYNVRGDISGGGNPHGLVALSVIAVLIMLMACFNYMNNTISSSSMRFKEIGVRKVVGSSRGQLTTQFLLESLMTSFVALILGLVLAESMFLPFFREMVSMWELKIDLINDGVLLGFLGVLVMSIGVIAGLYPSLYMSSFKAVRLMKGLQNVATNRMLTRILLVLQFGISMFAIVAAIVFKENNDHLRALDLGWKGDQIAVVRFRAPEEFHRFRDAIQTNPLVQQTAGSLHSVGDDLSVGISVESQGETFETNVLRIGAGYSEMVQMRVVQGRTFDPAIKTDVDESILVSRLFTEEMKWDKPIGRKVTLEGATYTVVGVMDDFYARTFMRPMQPVLIKGVREEDYRTLSVKMKTADAVVVRDLLEGTWKKIIPDRPFNLRFQDQVFEEDFKENEQIKNMFIYIAVMTMMIAATGLFALVSLNINKRTKEIGIRKVLGASAIHVVQLVNREFYVLIITASVLFFPLAYFILKGLISSVFQSTHVELSLLPFLISGIAMIVLAFITVGSRVYRIAVENPVKALRYE